MRAIIKKTYCSSRRRLAKEREQSEGRTVRVFCSRCGTLLNLWDGIFWKPVREGDSAKPILAAG